MNHKIFIIILFLGIGNLSIYGQFNYKTIPSKYLKLNNSDTYHSEDKDLYDLTNSLPENFVKNGSVDYTKYIQDGLNRYRNVKFPNFKILINEKGLTLNSASNIYFAPDSKLILKSSSLGTYEMLRLHNIENVNIYNPVIIGDREMHTGTTGEWGMGIAIRSSKNIRIFNARISNCWGDGIYIGQLKGLKSDNIQISNAFIDKSRRNGISITCGTNIRIINPLVANTHGAMPMFGIDIEPNNNNDVINNIAIENPVTYNNAEGGIVIGLGKLVGRNEKIVNISILNHIDDESKVGFYMGGMSEVKKRPGHSIKGNIAVINPKWLNNTTPFKSRSSFNRAPKLNVDFPSIVAPKRPAFTVQELKRINKNNKNIIIR